MNLGISAAGLWVVVVSYLIGKRIAARRERRRLAQLRAVTSSDRG